MELLPEEIDRISEELAHRLRPLPDACSRPESASWVNGAFTFTPDGNPLVGPVPGLRNFWAACGCMSGFSQGGAIGLVLANWMVDGDPGADIFGMDVARYGSFASNDKYLRDMTAQFYARRFVIAYPNEELPAGRPLKMTPSYDAQKAAGARFGVVWGMETPQYFAPGQPDFVEQPSLRRSNAHAIVAAEVAATRTAAGLLDTGVYGRYEVSGPGAAAWLDRLLANRLPPLGRLRLAPMLAPSGKLMGDLTVTRLEPERFWLVGSYYLQEWHLRWFRDHLPARGVRIENLSESWLGFSLSGPRSRDILARLTREDVGHAALPFLGCRRLDIGLTRAVVARLSLTGELGYEITVPAAQQRALWDALIEQGTPLGMQPIGMRAQDSLRLEKGYGVWSLEFATVVHRSHVGSRAVRRLRQGGFHRPRGGPRRAAERSGPAARAAGNRRNRRRCHRLRTRLGGRTKNWPRHFGRLRSSRQAKPGARLRGPRDRGSSFVRCRARGRRTPRGPDTRRTALRSAGPQAPRVTPARAPRRTTALMKSAA